MYLALQEVSDFCGELSSDLAEDLSSTLQLVSSFYGELHLDLADNAHP